MSSCGRGDKVPEQVSTWQRQEGRAALRATPGNPSQPRSARSSSRATEANSNPLGWCNPVLHYNLGTAKLWRQFFSHSRCSPVGPGVPRSLGCSRQSIPAHLRNSPCSALTGTQLECSVLFGDPDARERMKKQRWLPGCWAQLDEVSQQNVDTKKKLPSSKICHGKCEPVLREVRGKGTQESPGCCGEPALSDIFRGFHSSAAKFPGSFPQLIVLPIRQ